MSDTRVGFVGLGQIGRPMAQRLDDPIVYDVRAEACDGFARVASSAGEVAASSDVVSVMVRDDDQVREVIDAMMPHASADTIFAIHSTISPETAESVAASSMPVLVVDAPVSGGTIGAHEGSLVVMIGGPERAVARCRDAFAPWASHVVHAGGVGSATRMKIVRNLITFVSFTAAGEAQRLAEAAGLSLADLGNVVRHSDKVTGGPGAIMLRETTAPLGTDDPWRDILVHTAELGEKDLTLALELGRQLGVDLPLTAAALERFAEGLGVE